MKRLAGSRAIAFALVLATVAFVLAAELARRHALRFDWTREGRHALSDTTLRSLGALKEPVSVTFVMSAPAAPEDEEERVAGELAAPLRALLRAFARASGGRLTIESVDALAEPGRARALLRDFGVRLPNVLLVRRGKQQRVLGLSRFAALSERGPARLRAEGALVDALAALERPARTLLFTTAHGERSTAERGPEGLSLAARRLRNLGYAIDEAAVLTRVRPGTALVVIAGPERAFSDTEAMALDAYLTGGGAALMMFEPAPTGPHTLTGLEPLLAKRGLGLEQGTLHDPSRRNVGGATTLLQVDATDHPIARAVGHAPIVLGGVRPLRGGTAILHTSPRARRAPDAQTPPEERPARECVATASTTRGRLVLVGDTDFATNARLERGGHERLLTAAVDWLVDDTALEASAAPAGAGQRLRLSARAARVSFWLYVLVLPGLAATAAALLAVARRRRA